MSSIFPKRENRLVSTFFVFGCRHVELVQRLEGRVFVHEDVTLEPVWKSFGQLVMGVGGRGNGDWRGEYEHTAVRRDGKNCSQM